MSTVTETTIEQKFQPVNYQLPLFAPDPPAAMIHHNRYRRTDRIIIRKDVDRESRRYGVSSEYRVLSPQLLLKRFDKVRDCLKYRLDLYPAEVHALLRLLQLWAYYGNVYPKAALIADEEQMTPALNAWRVSQGLPPPRRSYGCSRATFWRMIKRLKEQGLIRVVNRYVIRPHAQISNLYRLDKLVLIIARYLREHGVQFQERWLQPYLAMPGSLFWHSFLERLLSDSGGLPLVSLAGTA